MEIYFLICFTLFLGVKGLTLRRAIRHLKVIPVGRLLGYCFLWPGMDARAFLTLSPDLPRPTAKQWLAALGKSMLGLILVAVIARQIHPTLWFYRDWTVLVGLGLLVPFGVFHLTALGWQAAGVDAKPIMNRPFLATSLSEFWGRRWNLAFRDAAHELIFRPVLRKVGPVWAAAATFVASGLFHEVTLSVPARGGYGLPLSYFLLQLVCVQTERSVTGSHLGLGRGWRGRIFCAVVVVLPAYALFHRWVLDDLLFPWLREIGLL